MFPEWNHYIVFGNDARPQEPSLVVSDKQHSRCVSQRPGRIVQRPLTIPPRQVGQSCADIRTLRHGGCDRRQLRSGQRGRARRCAAATVRPATWVTDPAKRQALGARLREGHAGYRRIRAIAEPLGSIYAALLDTHRQIVGNPNL